MRQQTTGRHTLTFEPPDLVVVRIDGDLSADEMRGQVEFTRSCLQGNEAIFILIDLARQGEMGKEARKAAAEASRDIPYGGVAIFNAGWMTRVVSRLMLGAMQLTRAGRAVPAMFAATEAEARAWLEERRRARGGVGRG